MDIALVHGAYHGAWCWDYLRPELELLGHRVIAVDLPVSDPGLGGDDHARLVEDAVAGSEAPIVVGHSMGGLIVPLVAARRPVRRLVFLAAMLPLPGVSANDQRAAEPIDGRFSLRTAEWTDLGDDVWAIGPATATELFFHDVPSDVVDWALKRLRPQSYRVFHEITPLAAWPAVESSVIVCDDDHAVNPDWVRMAARARLGVEAIEIPGGHSPFLSRPHELAAAIHACATA